jgi:hypothetical protein
LVSPVTVQNRARVEVQVAPPGVAVTVKEVTGEPPVLVGATQDTTEAPSTAVVAETDVGAPGTPRGTAPSDGRDAAEEPDRFEATTVNEYVTPLVSPSTTHEVSSVMQLPLLGFEVTV